MYQEIINQMDKNELQNLLSHYQDLANDAYECLYHRGELIDALKRVNQYLSLENLADRHYRETRSIVDKVEEELTNKYKKPYVGKRCEAGCIDDFLVEESNDTIPKEIID